MESTRLEARYPNVHALSHGCVSFPLDEWPGVKLEAGRLLAELARREDELARLTWVVKRAHGALTDAGTVVVPGVLDGDLAPAIRQLTRERDEARRPPHDPATCRVCQEHRKRESERR